MYFVSQVKLHFTENALRSIAKKAISKNTGARGLRSILESVLVDAMYEVCFFLQMNYLFLVYDIECRCRGCITLKTIQLSDTRQLLSTGYRELNDMQPCRVNLDLIFI